MKSNFWMKHLCLAIGIAAAWGAGLTIAAEPVDLDTGKISGAPAAEDPAVMVYKGIPFAAPPVGDLRWKPPQTVKSWEGVRECTAFSKACPQNSERLRIAYGTDIGPTSEDCLYLNVWSAGRPGDTRPVMVWIHGGGNTMGSGSTATYDGTQLAKKGVVLVTINYRLGAFGFLAHPALSKESPHGSSGNYGLLDQIAALEWVKRNIGAFGGNPRNITIFGESAGGVDVCCLMASPLAAGLIHRVIAESGTAIGVTAPLKGEGAKVSGEQSGVAFAKALGCDGEKDVLAAMRAKSAEDIVKTATANPTIASGPIVDGWVLLAPPAKAVAAGQANAVPFMAGTNANEGSLFLPRPLPNLEGYKKDVETRFGANASKVLTLYPAKEEADVRKAEEQMITDQRFAAGARYFVRESSKKNPGAYLYQFTHVRPDSGDRGAFHGLEIAYIFGTLSRGGKVQVSETDKKLSDAMSSYWANFAKAGDPNGEGLPKWPAYTAANDTHLELGDKIETKKNLRKAACDLFESLYGK